VADAARARAAYAADLAGLRAEVRRADDERAAWRERVEAAEREVARLRGFLPAVALVVCPACGGGVEGELDDDAEYITRLHHRGVARDGLSLVRCDGGIARESAQ
jgi:hypothetical protein